MKIKTRLFYHGNRVTANRDLTANAALIRDSFYNEDNTRAIPNNISLGRPFWKKVGLDLLAMTSKYGHPTFFITLSANEHGWDLPTDAPDNLYDDPVQTTRYINRMFQKLWSTFIYGKIRQTQFNHQSNPQSFTQMDAKAKSQYSEMLLNSSGDSNSKLGVTSMLN